MSQNRAVEWKNTVNTSSVYRDINPSQDDMDRALHESIHGNDLQKRARSEIAYNDMSEKQFRFEDAVGSEYSEHPGQLEPEQRQDWHDQISGHKVDPSLPLYSGTAASTDKIRPAEGTAGHGGKAQYKGAGSKRGELSEHYAWSHPSEALAWDFADSAADRFGKRGRVYQVEHAADETHGGSRLEPFEVKSPTGFDVKESIDIKPGHQGTFPTINWQQFGGQKVGKYATSAYANHPRDVQINHANEMADLRETRPSKPEYSPEITEHGQPGLFERKSVEHPMVSKPPMLGTKMTLDDHMLGWDKSAPEAASFNMNSAQARVNDINNTVKRLKSDEAGGIHNVRGYPTHFFKGKS